MNGKDEWMIKFARREWRRYDLRNYAVWAMIGAAVYAVWKWLL